MASLLLILLVVGLPLPSIQSTSSTYSKLSGLSDGEQELVLLRSEHYLYLNASDTATEFHVRVIFPPDYAYQVPLFLEIYNDSTADIIHYAIEDDVHEPNNLVNFTLGAMEKNESILLHFSFWVLVKNHDFSDLPKYVKIPKKQDLPNETKIWLTATEVVQAESILIKLKARQLRGYSDNLTQFAGVIAPYIKWHRYPLFVLELNLGLFFSQDAITTLFINGENVGRAHLACAFFRSNNVPARVLLAHNDQGFWTQMHYMLEYYCPGYGWVLVDPTKGETPYATKRQIINRVCYPEDENDTKTDYIFPWMKGEERWLWIDTEQVYPYYVDCKKGSKSQMFQEGDIGTDSFTGNYAFFVTQRVFHFYEQYLGMNLSSQNQTHFHTALQYQEDALKSFQESDIHGYMDNLERAYNEYISITL
jgi:hypothetical protein